MDAWQLPISLNTNELARRRLHYGPTSDDKSVFAKAACGFTYNPGFATRPRGVKYCKRCERMK